MKKFLVEMMNRFPFFMTQSIDWYGLKRVMNPFSYIYQARRSQETRRATPQKYEFMY